MCGEHQLDRFSAFQQHGSSPRVRGTRRPNRAGSVGAKVHPRVCGEHSRAALRLASISGSSPRVRGTLHGGGSVRASRRFIPACAGNTRPCGAFSPAMPVHPRVCGEHRVLAACERLMEGSSPRVRGTPLTGRPYRQSQRFIPACAGNTTPRAGGRLLDGGSSPRVRGTRRSAAGTGPARRFIPACAGNTAWYARVPRNRPVHPRVCGEHLVAGVGLPADRGSSPRVRGTRGLDPRQGLGDRFIPACAGNTGSAGLWPQPKTVHPRVCGEHATWIVSKPSSTRFIPACAGNTASSSLLASLPPVHPRVCGEHGDLLLRVQRHCGSSPRVRGTPPICLINTRAGRFIPACAGNTNPPKTGSGSNPVHPRVCGEHLVGTALRGPVNGSSPRVRGTLRDARRRLGPQRFIPACAGNTPCHGGSALALSVHPRVCGEHASTREERRSASGSSPRVRGTLSMRSACLMCLRFIPACAGNTAGNRFSRRRRAVHPRVCGEHCSMPAANDPTAGSSPRVRGTPFWSRRRFVFWRFIPACAGNTDLLPR